MFDAIDVTSLPAGADVYAGYDDGHWPDAAAIAARFGGKPVVRITVLPGDNEGDVLDVESGDATPQQAPAWVQRRRADGHTWPTVYCSESVWSSVIAAFNDAGVPQPFYWVAAYPGAGAAVPAGAVAHQWIDHGAYDESVTVPTWPPGAVPAPVPIPPPTSSPRGDTVLHTIPMPATDANGNGFVTTTIPWSSYCAATIQGSDPAADGGYWTGDVHVQDRGGNVLVSVTGAAPHTPTTVFIWATA
jgi:hypothetical protein